MDLPRVCGKRVARIDDRRLIADDEFDLVNDVLGFLFGGSDDRRDRLADEAHLAVGEDRLAERLVLELVQHRQDRLHAGEIGGGDHHRAVR